MTDLPQRKSPRLTDFSYTQPGAYFVTICTHQRELLFGNVVDELMLLNSLGEIVYRHLQNLPTHYPNLAVDCFVVMPNHLHVAFVLRDDPELRPDLNNVVGNYKAGVTRTARRELDDVPPAIWQRSYHDHIIRDDEDFSRIREYVQTNPLRWHLDTFYSP
jgi:REP element-mobilizing transposase RayT